MTLIQFLDSFLLSPYLSLILSFLVLYKWILKFIYCFKWTEIGALLSRFILFVVYLIVVMVNPSSEDIRLMVRTGINLLFIDELINWGSGYANSSVIGVSLYTKFTSLLKGVKNSYGKQG